MTSLGNVIVGVPGQDCHVIGAVLLGHALRRAGFTVVNLGAAVTENEFVSAAIETGSSAIVMSSLNGMARFEVAGLRDKLTESGLNRSSILLYIGGLLGTVDEDWEAVETRFKALGFDRVYPPRTPIHTAVRDLCVDLERTARSHDASGREGG